MLHGEEYVANLEKQIFTGWLKVQTKSNNACNVSHMYEFLSKLLDFAPPFWEGFDTQNLPHFSIVRSSLV